MSLHGAPPFSAHRRIPGRTLDPKTYAAMPPQAAAALAGDVAECFAAFHAIDPADAERAGCGFRHRWPDPAALAARLGERCPPRLARRVERVLAEYAAEPPDREVFGQFDTHGWNMALDQGSRLAGLFDFGYAGLGPLHRDLSYPAFVAADFAARVVATYVSLTGYDVDLGRCLLAHSTLRLIELADAAPADVPVRLDAFDRAATEAGFATA